MPSESKKQHNLMALVANNPKASKRLGIPKSVGEEFMKADKGKKFAKGGYAKGGMAKHEDVKIDKKVVKKAVGMHDKQLHGGKKTNLTKLKKGGMCKGYAEGGMPMVEKDGKKVPAFAADGKGKMAKGGCVKMARGGGIEKKGKTKGKII